MFELLDRWEDPREIGSVSILESSRRSGLLPAVSTLLAEPFEGYYRELVNHASGAALPTTAGTAPWSGSRSSRTSTWASRPVPPGR